jgi:hypothetical protein
MTDEQKARLLSLVIALSRAQPINRLVLELKALVGEVIGQSAVSVTPTASRKKQVAARGKPARKGNGTMRLTDEAREHIRRDLPYWIYRYADGSEMIRNRDYSSIWLRARIGTKADPGIGNTSQHPAGVPLVDSRRFYGDDPKFSPFHDPRARLRLERTLKDFIEGKNVWDEALFDAGYEPVRTRPPACPCLYGGP